MRDVERYLEVSGRRLAALSAKLKAASLQLSWWRLGVFGAFFVLCIALNEFGHWMMALGALLPGLLIFIWLVGRHQGIRRAQRRVDQALKLKTEHRARLRLDWSGIPELPLAEPVAGHPFEIDLDITGSHSLQRLLQTCLSIEGGQRLKDWLLALEAPADLVGRQQLVAELRSQIAFRDGLQLALAESAASYRHVVTPGKSWRSAEVLELLAELPSRNLGGILAGLSALAGLDVALYISAFVGWLPAWSWQLGLSLYILLFWTQRGRIATLFKESHQLQYGLTRIGSLLDYLGQRAGSRGPALQTLLAPFAGGQPAALLRQLGRIVGAAGLQGNPLVWVFFNLFIPWDYYFAWRLEQLKPRLRELLPQWLDVLWELEALSSLAHWAWLHPEAPFPQAREQGLQVTGLGHPLIPAAAKVRNDFTLSHTGEAFLITGSNMAGKSTFLKSLGVNLILAQAGTAVDAHSFAAAPLRLFTCIRVSDSVTDGLSYFYTEVRRLKALLDAVEQNQRDPVLFLVDEIFKGTNNRERLIGSRACIQALTGRHALGGVSTHDLELVQLADSNPLLHNYHFRETIAEGKMVFDFKLREGPCPTTNALRIMALEGLPVSLPDQADLPADTGLEHEA